MEFVVIWPQVAYKMWVTSLHKSGMHDYLVDTDLYVGNYCRVS